VVIENDRVRDWNLRCGEEYLANDGPVGLIAGSSSHDIWHHSHKKQIADMLAAIREDREPLVNGLEARRALAIVLGVYESARTGKPVKLD